jgi:hypothetical protein
MGLNRYKPHLFVLPEDDANRQIANRFLLSFEDIGEGLANDCADNTNSLWGHPLLRHNRAELDRMIAAVKPFLFQGP